MIRTEYTAKKEFVMGPEADAAFLSTLARRFNVRFSLMPTDVNVVGREVTAGFELQLVGTHPDPSSSNARSCSQCQRVLMGLLEFAEWVAPTRTSGPGRNRGYEKLTSFSSGIGCDGQVSLLVRLVQARRFEQAIDGWALEFLEQVRRFLLEQGCRQIELSAEAERGPAPLDEPDRHRPRALGQSNLVPTHVA